MFSFPKFIGLTALVLAGAASAQTPKFDGIGRMATPAEVKAWDIDVRPDFKGLPPGRGTVAQGQDVWEAKCAGCHGVFGESNEVFSALVGGTTKDDIKTGHVARLTDPSFPGRTTMMKVSHISTLWDYINRAMPWSAPKSLKPDEVYAVTAYLLSLADVLPGDGELSDKNIAQVQERLPNRKGKTWEHAMWPGSEFAKKRKPDAQGSNCMSNCPAEAKIASFLPDFARNAHGNLSEQQRLVGPQRGVDTTQAAGSKGVPAMPVVAAAAAAPAAPKAKPVSALLTQHACMACHQIATKVVGPAFKDVAAKYKDRADARAFLASRIKSGSTGVWGPIPMPAQNIPEADLNAIAAWLADGAKPLTDNSKFPALEKTPMSTTRRNMIKHSATVAGLLAAAGMLPGQAFAQAMDRKAFDAKNIDELTKALGLAKPVESNLVTLTGPDIAENGAVVPLAAASTAPGVKRLMLLVEKNPSVLTASFDVTEFVEPAMSTRVKMGQTSNVYAVAVTNDNKVLFAQKEVKVTLGGCGG